MRVMSLLFPENYPLTFSLLLGTSEATPSWLASLLGAKKATRLRNGRTQAGLYSALVTTATLFCGPPSDLLHSKQSHWVLQRP